MKLKKVWKNLLESHWAISVYFVILSHRGVWNFVLFSFSEQGFVPQTNQESLTGYFKAVLSSHPGGRRDFRLSVARFILFSKRCQLQLHTTRTRDIVLFFP